MQVELPVRVEEDNALSLPLSGKASHLIVDSDAAKFPRSLSPRINVPDNGQHTNGKHLFPPTTATDEEARENVAKDTLSSRGSEGPQAAGEVPAPMPQTQDAVTIETMHRRSFAGDGWARLLPNMRQQVEEALRREASKATALPLGNVSVVSMNVDRTSKLVTELALLHDASKSAVDMDNALNVYRFPEMKRILKMSGSARGQPLTDPAVAAMRGLNLAEGNAGSNGGDGDNITDGARAEARATANKMRRSKGLPVEKKRSEDIGRRKIFKTDFKTNVADSLTPREESALNRNKASPRNNLTHGVRHKIYGMGKESLRPLPTPRKLATPALIGTPRRRDAPLPTSTPRRMDVVSPAGTPRRRDAPLPTSTPHRMDVVSPAGTPRRRDAPLPTVTPRRMDVLSPTGTPRRRDAPLPAGTPRRMSGPHAQPLGYRSSHAPRSHIAARSPCPVSPSISPQMAALSEPADTPRRRNRALASSAPVDSVQRAMGPEISEGHVQRSVQMVNSSAVSQRTNNNGIGRGDQRPIPPQRILRVKSPSIQPAGFAFVHPETRTPRAYVATTQKRTVIVSSLVPRGDSEHRSEDMNDAGGDDTKGAAVVVVARPRGGKDAAQKCPPAGDDAREVSPAAVSANNA